MDPITIYFDNSLNNPDKNPPGFNQWIGGQGHGDPLGIKVDKTDTHLEYKLS